MPTHVRRICAVIDQLPPDLVFGIPQGSELQFEEASGLSQELGSLPSEHSNVEPDSPTSQNDSELAPIVSQMDPPKHLRFSRKGTGSAQKAEKEAWCEVAILSAAQDGKLVSMRPSLNTQDQSEPTCTVIGCSCNT